jgi:UPF0755 protein
MTWIALIAGGIFLWQYSSYENTILTQEETTIEVTGWGFQSLLINAGASPIFTKIYLWENSPNFELQKGSYIIPAGANINTYLENLRFPINQTDINLTFLEWWNIFDIDQYLTQKELINTWAFIEYSENFCNPEKYPSALEWKVCDLSADFPFLWDTQSLEWFLYPDTYAINPNNFNARSLAIKMLSNFTHKIIDSGIINDMGSIEILDVINLASIVEKEERNASEKSTVAGILKKRLDEWWMIGADITVCYPYRLTAEECKLSVTKYLYEVNDYNTRQKTGLPAGPIWNPSFESIDATLNSKDSEYYYYLHDTQTGQIYYGKDNAEHERNKQLYLR